MALRFKIFLCYTKQEKISPILRLDSHSSDNKDYCCLEHNAGYYSTLHGNGIDMSFLHRDSLSDTRIVTLLLNIQVLNQYK